MCILKNSCRQSKSILCCDPALLVPYFNVSLETEGHLSTNASTTPLTLEPMHMRHNSAQKVVTTLTTAKDPASVSS